ncbi:MAG TPA: hypothetical protein VHC63_08360 [Acidimicrobiales bacterium]|nr:hypothetical protein [Acidimicrobiales bacterium]
MLSDKQGIRLELGGSMIVGGSRLAWSVLVGSKRGVPADEPPDADEIVWGAEAWDQERRLQYVMRLTAKPHLTESETPEAPADTREGVLLDVSGQSGDVRVRVLGISGTTTAGGEYDDSSTPTIPGHDLIFSLETGNQWLGLFAPFPTER